MKMIWPGRALGVALLVPALASLALLVSESIVPVVLVLDVAVALVAFVDLFTLMRRRPIASRAAAGPGLLAGRARRKSSWCSRTRAASPGSLRLRDDVPDEFSADPAAFEVAVPGRRQAVLAYRVVPKRRGTYVFERVDALVASRLGFWRRQCCVAAAGPRSGFIPTSTRSPGSRCWRGATG